MVDRFEVGLGVVRKKAKNVEFWRSIPPLTKLIIYLLLLKEKYVRQNSTFSASSSAHDARRHLHP
jgi:hypothetical protein